MGSWFMKDGAVCSDHLILKKSVDLKARSRAGQRASTLHGSPEWKGELNRYPQVSSEKG